MGKLPMELKIAIDYSKHLKYQNYTLAKIFIRHQDINYLQRLLTKTGFFENRLIESITKPKDLWKALRSLGLPSKTSSGEVDT